MDLRQHAHPGCLHRRAVPRSTKVFAAAAKPQGKGFGTAQKDKSGNVNERKGGEKGDKRVVQEAAAAALPRPSHRPIRPEEASKGKLDYVQVADWGDGIHDRLGELRLVSHVPQYEGGESSAVSEGRDGGPRPFHMQLANQLKMAESRGALAIAGPPPPSLTEWSFREGRYVQYLADQLELHAALEEALTEAASRVPAHAPASPAPPQLHAPAPATGPDATQATSPHPTAAAAAASTADPSPPPSPSAPPPPCGLRALQHLLPSLLGLGRSAALRRDLVALRDTAGHPVTPEAAAAAGSRRSESASGPGVAEAPGPLLSGAAAVPASTSAGAQGGQRGGRRGDIYAVSAGPMARSYGQFLRRLGRVAASGESEEERQAGALKLLSHAAVVHMVGQAAGVRLGAMATEKLALLPRRAAATYHEYPEDVKDPRVTLATALDGAAEHLRSSALRQMIFDEMPSAMQKTGLLLTALAHRD